MWNTDIFMASRWRPQWYFWVNNSNNVELKNFIFNIVISEQSLYFPTEGSSFAFGLPGGLLSLNFFDWQRTDEKTDRLVFRVQTNLSNSIMLRVISSNSNEYLQVEVVSSFTCSTSYYHHALTRNTRSYYHPGLSENTGALFHPRGAAERFTAPNLLEAARLQFARVIGANANGHLCFTDASHFLGHPIAGILHFYRRTLQELFKTIIFFFLYSSWYLFLTMVRKI